MYYIYENLPVALKKRCFMPRGVACKRLNIKIMLNLKEEESIPLRVH